MEQNDFTSGPFSLTNPVTAPPSVGLMDFHNFPTPPTSIVPPTTPMTITSSSINNSNNTNNNINNNNNSNKTNQIFLKTFNKNPGDLQMNNNNISGHNNNSNTNSLLNDSYLMQKNTENVKRFSVNNLLQLANCGGGGVGVGANDINRATGNLHFI